MPINVETRTVLGSLIKAASSCSIAFVMVVNSGEEGESITLAHSDALTTTDLSLVASTKSISTELQSAFVTVYAVIFDATKAKSIDVLTKKGGVVEATSSESSTSGGSTNTTESVILHLGVFLRNGDDEKIFYAKNSNGAGFQVESTPIDTNFSLEAPFGSSGISLDLDSQGLPHFGYKFSRIAHYAYKANIATWETLSIPNSNKSVTHLSFALSMQDIPFLAVGTYDTPNGFGQFGIYKDLLSSPTYVNSPGLPAGIDISGVSVAYDSASRAIMVGTAVDFTQAQWPILLGDADDWTKAFSNIGPPNLLSSLCSANILSPEIALDSEDKMHIVFLCEDQSHHLAYMTNKGGDWMAQHIVDVGSLCQVGIHTISQPSIRIDGTDNVHLAVGDCGENRIK